MINIILNWFKSSASKLPDEYLKWKKLTLEERLYNLRESHVNHTNELRRNLAEAEYDFRKDEADLLMQIAERDATKANVDE